MAVLIIVPLLNSAMSSCVCCLVLCASGTVTLKKAWVDTFSKGPGVSMEAVVVARMKGGVSLRVGRTCEGISTMCFSLMSEFVGDTVELRLVLMQIRGTNLQ